MVELDYRGAPQTIAVIKKAVLDSQSKPQVRMLAEEVTKHLQSKDRISEALAIYYLVVSRTRYMSDPRTVELVRAPWVVIDQMMAGHTPGLDCFPTGTLLLDSQHRLVSVEDLVVGQKIWGRDRWSEVEAVAYKGIRTVDAIFLNNGSQITVTPDHKIYVRECGKHGGQPCGKNCKHNGDLDHYIRIPVSEAEPWMIVLSPRRIAFGDRAQDPDRALIEGLYLSDGWHQKSAFAISGQDGQPKEAQKKKVEEICRRLGVPTTWYRKSIHVRDSEWALRTQLMGSRAPEKHALDIGLVEPAARALLDGIMADSGANTHGAGRTFTTTSFQLFLQARMLLKMQGISCSERFIREHGGLGKNPIWRLGLRGVRQDQKREKTLRIRSIERSVAEVPTWDIQTDDHYVYLPSADATVSNCDDLSALICALLIAAGHQCRVVTVAFRNMFYKGQRQYSHVFAQVKEPYSGEWITLDPVAAEKTEEMKGRVRAAKFWPIA